MTAHASKDARAWLGSYPVAVDARDFNTSQVVDVIEGTAMADDAKVFTAGQKSSTIRIQSRWMPGAGRSYAAFKDAVGAGDLPFTESPFGNAFGSPVRCVQALTSNVNETAPMGGLLASNADITGDGPLEYGVLLHGESEEEDDGIGTTFDAGADSTKGATIYAHCLSTPDPIASMALTIEHSSDSATWEPLTGGVVLSPNTGFGPGSARVRVEGSVGRYVRATWDLSGNPFVFVVALCRS